MGSKSISADGYLGTFDEAPAVIQSEAQKQERTELEAAAAAVHAAAAVFDSVETSAYAKSWTRRLLDTGTTESTTNEFYLCEACLDDPDSEECVKLEESIKALQRMVGVDWAGTA